MEAFDHPPSTGTVTASLDSPTQQRNRLDTDFDSSMLDSQSGAFVSDEELHSFANMMGQADDKFLPLGSFNNYGMLSTGEQSYAACTETLPATATAPQGPTSDCISPQSLDAHHASFESNTHLGGQSQPIQVDDTTHRNTEKMQPEPPRRRGRPRKAKQDKSSYSTQNNTAVSPAQPPPAPLESNTSQDQTSGEQDLEDTDDGKKRLRARNRESAKRFRIRKRDGIERLRDKEDKAKKTNERLVEEATKLRDETLELKSMVLQHAGCGCQFIEEYIGNMAANLAQKSSPNYTESYTGTSPSVAMSNDAGTTDIGD